MSTDAAAEPETTQPEPELAGTFAIYADGRGGYVLVTDTVDQGTTRKHIPAALVKLATGNGVIGKIFGNREAG